ncbi:MAG: DUF5667 domain-containing protein [Anaerolineales bacterium]
MNEKLYDAFDVCVKALETGADIEAVLKLYPEMTDELRPVLEALIQAQSLSTKTVSEDTVRRGRARVLQHATLMRESSRRQRKLGFVFRRLAASLALTFVLLLGGTGIVSASAGALPGDNLYPVKRTWETVRLWFVFSPEGREELESEYEQERLDEIDELLGQGREEVIAFYGIVTTQDGEYWLVSGVPVQITAKTQLPAETVSIGAPVTVVGRTNAQGFIEAQMLGVLAPGVSLPPLEPNESTSDKNESNEADDHGENAVLVTPQAADRDSGVTTPQPQVENNNNLQDEQSRTFEFRGVVSSQKDGIWVINGQQVDMSQADIIGNIQNGTFVKLNGYYGLDGRFIVTKIEQRDDNNKNSGSSDNSNNDNRGDEGGQEDNKGDD